MEITFSGFYTEMAQKIFDISYVDAFVEQVGGKTVALASGSVL
jgi:hypothetical protein